MFKFIKKILLKHLTGARVKASYDDLTLEEKVACNEMWRLHKSCLEKIVKIVIGDVIQQYARNNRETEFAKEILTLQNDLIMTYHDLIEREQRRRGHK